MPVPGWYPNPDGTPTRRYWDGYSWTEHRQLAPAPAPVPPTAPYLPARPYQSPAAVMGTAPVLQPAATNSLATAALVLGIVGAVVEWGGILTFAAGVLAIVFGAMGISRARPLGNLNKGRAIAGLILGCFAVLAYFFWGLVTLGIFWII